MSRTPFVVYLVMEESEDDSRKRKGKFRSSRRKKRKGFHGKKRGRNGGKSKEKVMLEV